MIGSLRDFSNNTIRDDLEMAIIINTYFSAIFTQSSGKCLFNIIFK